MSEDARLLASKHVLAAKLALHCAGRAMDKQTIHDCEQIYASHRTATRLDGVDFPELVALVMDQRNTITFVRRDLDAAAIDVLVIELAKSQETHRPSYYDPAEIARALRRAFPHHETAE